MRMRYGLTVTSHPNEEPVATSEALEHLRVDEVEDWTYVNTLISAARNHVESVTRRALVTQTLQLTLDHFPGVAHGILDLRMQPDQLTGYGNDWVIRLPRSPLQSVTSIQYVDDAGDTQTLASSKYIVDASSQVPRITPAYTEVWPTTRPIPNAVTISFVAGYGAAADVPAALKQAMLILIGTMFEHRESVVLGTIATRIPHTFDYLVAPYRVATHAGA